MFQPHSSSISNFVSWLMSWFLAPSTALFLWSMNIAISTLGSSLALASPGGASSQNRQDIVVDVSGQEGANATHGSRGYDGTCWGEEGCPGGDAGSAQAGEHAGKIQIHLSVDPRYPNQFLVEGNKQKLSHHFGQSESLQERGTLGSSTNIILKARGGRGGDGGQGGAGGTGHRGRNGQNATRHSDGTDGEDGERGGSGGLGTSGADGGNGGKIEIQLGAENAHLLMLLRTDVSGEDGGNAGRHGNGGSGGRGGTGGSEIRWETQHYETVSRSRTDENGNRIEYEESVLRTHHHHRRGGRDGNHGPNGSKHRDATPLSPGERGQEGGLSIALQEKDGSIGRYQSVYSLAVKGFQISAQSGNGIFEFGDLVRVENIRVKNEGGMPTPAFQKTVLFLENGINQWIVFENLQGDLEIPQSLQPGAETVIPGPLYFRIKDFSATRSAEPKVVQDGVLVRAKIREVNREFTHGAKNENIQIQFPLETGTIQTLEALVPGEVTRLSWRLKNISKKSLGIGAGEDVLRRSIQIRIIPKGELAKDIVFYDSQGNEFLSDPVRGGYLMTVPLVSPDYPLDLGTYVGLRPNASNYKRAKLDLELHLENPTKTESRMIQMRDASIQASCPYNLDNQPDILLITNSSTQQEQVTDWIELAHGLGHRLGLWNVSLLGKVDFNDIVNCFHGKKIIVLDNLINQKAFSDVKEWVYPHDLLDKSNFFEVISRQKIKILFLGGNRGQLSEVSSREKFYNWLLAPSHVKSNRTDSKDEKQESETAGRTKVWSSIEAFLNEMKNSLNTKSKPPAQAEANLFLSERSYEIEVKDTFTVSKPSVNTLKEKADQLLSELKKIYPEKRYWVVYDNQMAVTQGEGLSSWFGKTYRLGRIRVIQTLDKTSSYVSYATMSSEHFEKTQYVKTSENLHHLIFSLQFEDKVKLFKRLLESDLNSKTDSNLISNRIDSNGLDFKTFVFIDQDVLRQYNQRRIPGQPDPELNSEERTLIKNKLGLLLSENLLFDLAIEQRAVATRSWNAGLEDKQIENKIPYLKALVECLLQDPDRETQMPVALDKMTAKYFLEDRLNRSLLVDLFAKIRKMSKDHIMAYEYLIPGRRTKEVHEEYQRLYNHFVTGLTERAAEAKANKPSEIRKTAELDYETFKKEMDIRRDALADSVGNLKSKRLIENLQSRHHTSTDSQSSFTHAISEEELTLQMREDEKRQSECQKIFREMSGNRASYLANWSCQMPGSTPWIGYVPPLPSAPLLEQNDADGGAASQHENHDEADSIAPPPYLSDSVGY